MKKDGTTVHARRQSIEMESKRKTLSVAAAERIEALKLTVLLRLFFGVERIVAGIELRALL